MSHTFVLDTKKCVFVGFVVVENVEFDWEIYAAADVVVEHLRWLW